MTDCDFNLDLFTERALHTAAWCMYRLSITREARYLWSIMPPDEAFLYMQPEDARHKLLHRISESRRQLVKNAPARLRDDALNLYRQGRLLVFFPNATLTDGSASGASNGFFDVHNYPPPDTWLYYTEGELLAWIPPDLVQAAEAGMKRNPEQCMLFLTDWTPPCYVEVLREANMLC